MKNILTILKELGIEVPSEKEASLTSAVNENYKTVADYNKQKDKLDEAQEKIKANDTAIKDLQTKLDEFKDADVSGLKQRIADLEKEKTTIQSDYESKIADRDFLDLVKECISTAKGKNSKAIMALLDVDKLKQSKNQKEDVAAALKALSEAEDSKMLFGDSKTVVREGNPIGEVKKDGAASGDSLRGALAERYANK